jgi:peptidoglycan-associated lipoprotein
MLRTSSGKWLLIVLTLSVALLATACRKKVASAPPPPPAPVVREAPTPPPPQAPVIQEFTAKPASIRLGESTILRWSVTNATDVSIEPMLGAVASSGTRRAFPQNSTTFAILAKGAGGSASANVTVEVSLPPPPAAAPPQKTISERLGFEVQDAYFDFDKSDIRDDASVTLTKDAAALKAIVQDFSSSTVVIEGHCDERGSAAYNLALGDRRATRTKEFLVDSGVPADRLRAISYGKERPQCTESNEDCWQRNRRAHFVPGK